MKKIYQVPAAKSICMLQNGCLMQASINKSKRNLSGDITNKGVPTSVVEGFNPDESYDGQNGMGSIRSREADYWDDYDE